MFVLIKIHLHKAYISVNGNLLLYSISGIKKKSVYSLIIELIYQVSLSAYQTDKYISENGSGKHVAFPFALANCVAIADALLYEETHVPV